MFTSTISKSKYLFSGHRRSLTLGLIALPITYYIYTHDSVTLPRLQCHIPSIEGTNILFEITPFIFIIAVGYLLFRFSIRALMDRNHIFDNGMALTLAFFINIFAFALVYFTYGLERPLYLSTTISTQQEFAPSVRLQIQRGEVFLTAESYVSDIYSNADESALPFAILENRTEMISDRGSYLAFSLANAIPGAQAFDYKACPSASLFVMIQNIFGLGMALIFGLYVARISPIFEPRSKNAAD